MSITNQMPLPDFFDSQRVKEVYRVPYRERAIAAEKWAKELGIEPAASDRQKIGLLLIDVQNTFCIPDFELFVAGKSGMGAVEDNIRLCQFIYRNLGCITEIIPTMDSHTAMQIFHPIFWVNDAGQHPEPATNISLADVTEGVWKANPQLAHNLTAGDGDRLQQHALHYVTKLSDEGKYPLTVWPYHSMLGGIGHALVSAVEEAVFFHSIARISPTKFELKGDNPLTENYSVLSPEVLDTIDRPIARKNATLIDKLLDFDKLLIGGQAKSHCVAWTVDNLLTEIQNTVPTLAQKIYLLEDCMSPVVIPGVVDFSQAADDAFRRFTAAGMHSLESTDDLC